MRTLLVAFLALSAACGAWAATNRPVTMDDTSGDPRVRQAWYLPSVWQQTLGSGYPTAAEYAPAGTTDGPRLSSVQFSASATQAIHFTSFFPRNFYYPSMVDVTLSYDASVGSTVAKGVVWKLSGWRVTDGMNMATLSTTPTFTTTWAKTLSTTARTYTVDTRGNAIPSSSWTFTPSESDMYLFRLSREYAYPADTCTSVINLYGVWVKLRTNNLMKQIGW